jgi:hypothetical protein
MEHHCAQRKPAAMKEIVRNMVTDPARIRRTDFGNPIFAR